MIEINLSIEYENKLLFIQIMYLNLFEIPESSKAQILQQGWTADREKRRPSNFVVSFMGLVKTNKIAPEAQWRKEKKRSRNRG